MNPRKAPWPGRMTVANAVVPPGRGDAFGEPIIVRRRPGGGDFRRAHAPGTPRSRIPRQRALVNEMVRLTDKVGGALPGRKLFTLVAAILAGATHIDHVDRLRAGGTARVLPFRVMAPSTLGTFLRAFTFGQVHQLERAAVEAIRRAGVWVPDGRTEDDAMTIDQRPTRRSTVR